MREFYETSYANVHRGVYDLAERATAGYEGAREKVRALINAPSMREVIFTRNVTEGLNLVAYSWGLDNLGPGDVVVVTELEHHANFVPWQQIAKRTGAGFRVLDIDDAGELRLDELDGLAAAGNVKVVATGLVSNTLGTINPIERLVGMGARAGGDHGRRRGPGGSSPAGRRAGARLRLPRLHLAQALRPHRGRRAVRPARAARGDAAVRDGRRDDPQGHRRGDDLERPSVQVRGRHSRVRRGLRNGRRDRLHHRDRPRGDRAARARARRLHGRAALRAALGDAFTGHRSTGVPASSRSTSTASTRTTSRRSSTPTASASAPATIAPSR